ncbi:MAG TPA: hypothetical protein VH439_00720 [Gemmatimonadales bacterium]|jgi:hypothetical protein
MLARSWFTIAAVLITACSRGPKLETRTFEVKYLGGREAFVLLSPYVSADHADGKGLVSYDDNSVRVSATHDNLEKIARVLASYDRPLTVRLTFQLIEADGATRVDPAIADIETTLRQLFRFRGYRLVGDGVITALENSAVSQMVGRGTNNQVQIAAHIERVVDRGDSATVLLQVSLDLFPGTFQTRVGVPVGKTAVLGNVLGGPTRTTLILTVRPEIVSAASAGR